MTNKIVSIDAATHQLPASVRATLPTVASVTAAQAAANAAQSTATAATTTLTATTALATAAAPSGATVYAEKFRDGIRTDTQILSAAFAALTAGGCLKLGQGVTYALTGGAMYDLTTKPNVLIDGQGATINGAAVASGVIVRLTGGIGAINTTLTAAIAARTETLTVVSTTGFVAGGGVKITSSGEPGNPDRLAEFKQEVGRIKSITNGTTLVLESRTWDTYALGANTVTVQYFPPMRNLRLKDLTVLGAGGGSNQSGLQVSYFDGVRVENVTVSGAGVEGISISTGIDAVVRDCRATGPNLLGVGYGFHPTTAQGIRIINCYGKFNRHSFDADRVRDLIYEGCTAERDTSAGFSTHGTTSVVRMINNTAKDCGGGFIARGSHHKILNNHVLGSLNGAQSSESFHSGIHVGDDGANTWGVGLAGIGLVIRGNDINLSGNDFGSEDSYGIYMTPALIDADISDNVISGYGLYGIYAKGDYGSRVTINDNKLNGSAQVGTFGVTAAHAIFLSPSHAVSGNTYNEVQINNNKITGAFGAGIRVKGNPDGSGPVTDNIEITNNKIGACGVGRVHLAEGYYGRRLEVWGNEWLGILPSEQPVVQAATSFYLAMPFIGANGWANKGVRFLGDGMQLGARLRSGLYYATVGFSGGAGALTLNRLFATPFFVPNRKGVDRLAVNVTIVGAAASVVRMGIYADVQDDQGGYPGDLVSGTETTVPGDAVAFALNGITTVWLSPGLYWLAAVAQGGTPTVTILSSIAAQIIGYQSTGSVAGRTCYTQDSVSGALPTTFTTSVSASGSPPMVHVRFA